MNDNYLLRKAMVSSVFLGLITIASVYTSLSVRCDEPAELLSQEIAGEDVADATVILEDIAITDDLFVEQAEAPDGLVMLLLRYTRTETALARRVCELTDEQDSEFVKLDEDWLMTEIENQKKVRKKREVVPAGNAGGFFQFMFGAAVNRPAQVAVAEMQPQQIFQAVSKTIDMKIKSILDESQWTKFTFETDARDEFARQARAEVYVSMLDRIMYLNDNQKSEIQRRVAPKFNDDFAWQSYLQNPNYLPQVDASVFTSLLDKQQKSILNGIQQINFGSPWDNGLANEEPPILIKQ